MLFLHCVSGGDSVASGRLVVGVVGVVWVVVVVVWIVLGLMYSAPLRQLELNKIN